MRKNNETLPSAIITALPVCLLGAVITFILAYVLDILVLSAAIPQLNEIFPSLEATLSEISIDDKAANRLSKIIFSACMLTAFIPSFVLSYRLSKKRKEKFLSETNGLIPVKEGLIYHFKNHWLSEAAIFIFNLAVSIFANIFSPTFLFRILCGKALSLPLSIIFILAQGMLRSVCVLVESIG